MLHIQDLLTEFENLPTGVCIGHYIPQHSYESDENWLDHHFTRFILDIKGIDINAIELCVELISQNIYGFDAVCVVPSSTPGKISGIQKVAQALAKSEGIVDATDYLIRHSTPDLDKTCRTVDTHLKSILLKEDPKLIQDKNVLLLDDVRTTGSSLQACKQILEQASPKFIIPLAIAKTYYRGKKDLVAKMYSNLERAMEDYYIEQEAKLGEEYVCQLQGLEHARKADAMEEYYIEEEAKLGEEYVCQLQGLEHAREADAIALNNLYSLAYGC